MTTLWTLAMGRDDFARTALGYSAMLSFWVLAGGLVRSSGRRISTPASRRARHNEFRRASFGVVGDHPAAKVVLEPDDIPESGDMAGRSRLEVVNPQAAEQPSTTSDLHLTDLLPPAPV
jgi:hypothetical protein